VAGFLGAGKTTLMRHLLTAKHGMKIAAMVNDFAALNIDAALIREVTEDTTALDNGCICCSLSGGIARGLSEIAARNDPVDAVLIEASGVSDPASIAQVAGSVDGISLDCIVTVVDAAESAESKNLDDLLMRQVAPANLVLLNKIDLVAGPQVGSLVEHLAALAPRAQILRTVNCAVPPIVIFDSATKPDCTIENAHTDHVYTTLILTSPRMTDRGQLKDALASLPDRILRIKGFVQLSDTPETLSLLQGVGRRWTLKDASGSHGVQKLVVIGQTSAMDRDHVLAHFAPLGFKLDEPAS
jgi:G3E family GTPase